jgi:hypothetical protein
VSIDYHWKCTAEGIVSYDFGSLSLPEEGSFTFNVTNAEGVWLPAADLLVPGYAWKNVYTMESSIDAGGTSLTTSTSVDQDSSVVGFEDTTAEAGTFSTMRVESAGTFRSEIAGVPPINFDTQSTAWFGYGIGMVRQVSSSSGASSTTSLVGYTMP